MAPLSYPLRLGTGIALMLLLTSAGTRGGSLPFDHDYAAFGGVLAGHARGDRVDYRALTANRTALDAVVRSFDAPTTRQIATWTEAEQLAFWINAYNAFTLRVVVDHYPIERRRFSLQPDNSIRQIAGVWNRLTWKAAGRTVTLDHIEHEILRVDFDEPRIHFALNCASISCPPLAGVPYRGPVLDAQLDDAAKRYLSSPEGVVLKSPLLRVSSLFKWYGDDFVARYAALGGTRGSARDRAIRGLVLTYAPEDIATAVARRRLRISFLPYDWSLNDAESTR